MNNSSLVHPKTDELRAVKINNAMIENIAHAKDPKNPLIVSDL
jgi:hypothetical protein